MEFVNIRKRLLRNFWSSQSIARKRENGSRKRSRLNVEPREETFPSIFDPVPSIVAERPAGDDKEQWKGEWTDDGCRGTDQGFVGQNFISLEWRWL